MFAKRALSTANRGGMAVTYAMPESEVTATRQARVEATAGIYSHIVNSQGVNVVKMSLPTPFVVRRGSGQTFTAAARAADTSGASETIISGAQYEQTTTIRAGLFSAADASDYRPQGEVVQAGKLVGGRTAPQTFFVSWKEGAGEDPSDQWSVGFGDPPIGADVAFGGAAPVIVGGLPYGRSNTFGSGAPEGLPATGDPGAANRRFLTQRSSNGFKSLDSESPSVGLVVLGIERDKDLLYLVVQAHGSTPGMRLSQIRDYLLGEGVDDAIALDGSTTATLVQDNTVVAEPSQYKNNTLPYGIGFRR